MKNLILLALALMLTACVPTEAIKPPTVVQVVVDHYIAVPEELTTPCPIATLVTLTNGELARVEHEMKDSLQRCNKQLEQIRALGNP